MQLIELAGQMIEQEGIEALRHSELAKRAGCTRALVYRYFPKKTDFYYAICDAFFQEFDRRLSFRQQHNAVALGQEGSKESRRFFDVLFEVLDQRGTAALVLNNTPLLNHEFRSSDSILRQHFFNRWQDAYESRKIVGVHLDLMVMNSTSLLLNYYSMYQQGQLAQDTAKRELEHTVYQLVSYYSEVPTQ